MGAGTSDADQFAAVLGTDDVDDFAAAIEAPSDEVAMGGDGQSVSTTFAFALAAVFLALVAASGTLAGYRRSADALADAGLGHGRFFAPAMGPDGLVAATLTRWTNRSR